MMHYFINLLIMHQLYLYVFGALRGVFIFRNESTCITANGISLRFIFERSFRLYQDDLCIKKNPVQFNIQITQKNLNNDW